MSRPTPKPGDRILAYGRLSVVRTVEPADEFRPAGIVSSVVLADDDGTERLGRSREWTRLEGDAWAWPDDR